MTNKQMARAILLVSYIIGGLILSANLALAAPTFPTLDSHVVDQVGLLSMDKKQDIANKLVGLEQQTNIQFVVAIVTSLEGYDIREYGIELARHWQLGQKDINNGVLLLVAPNERKVAIEVGYGLEGDLTDALSFQIIQNYILPKFKQGQMGEGIMLGSDMILQSLAGEISAQSLEAINNSSSNGLGFLPGDIIGKIFMAFFFLVVIFIVVSAFRNPNGVRFGGGSGSSSSSSSSWGGGSSNSFSGGGGSFGGGGASGGW